MLQFDNRTSVPLPGSGARWVHLYGGALLLYVVLPRLLLALPAALRAWRLARHFPLDLEQPYYRKLTQVVGGEAGLLRVLPYSMTLDEPHSRGLAALARHLLGEQARLRTLPLVSYGADPERLLGGLERNGATMTAVLFNLAATPEQENHGAFLAGAARLLGNKMIVLLDQSALAARLDAARLRERVELWRAFCIFHGAEPTLVDLLELATDAKDKA
jgi:hypothetical protein